MTQEIILLIQDLSRGGAGVGKLEDGRVVFVPFTAPGDRVRIRILRDQKNYLQGECLEILTPSTQRVQPRCPVFQKCGGCSWQHLPYSLQWDTKLKGIRHGLKRVGIEEEVIESYPAVNPWNYRNRMQFRGENSLFGMFERGTRHLVPVESCDIARPEINANIPAIRAKGSKHPYKVEIEVLDNGEVVASWNARHAARGFRQVNDAQNLNLRKAVSSRITTSHILYDLFGGSGNLSLELQNRVREIHCVDVSAPAKPLPGTPSHIHFHSRAVLPWILGQPPEGQGPHSAIIDPPRDGLSRDILEFDRTLRRLGVTEVVAVGCDVDAWSGDLRRWVDCGWKIRSLAAVDLFPQTPHVEAIAQLYL